MNRDFIFSLILFVIIYSCANITDTQEVPNCIEEKIFLIKNQPIANPPISVYQYTYNNQLVYYISSPCCDQYSTLYDINCNVICHPDGGITGQGDGICDDFFEKRINEKLIWKDKRKP